MVNNPLVEAVMNHALKRYNDSFEWSAVYECISQTEMLEELQQHNIETPEDAIAHYQSIVDIRDGSDYGGKGSVNW